MVRRGSGVERAARRGSLAAAAEAVEAARRAAGGEGMVAAQKEHPIFGGAAAAAALHPAVAKDPLYDVGKVARVGVGGRRPSAMASAGSPLDLALALQAYAPPATQGLFAK